MMSSSILSSGQCERCSEAVLEPVLYEGWFTRSGGVSGIQRSGGSAREHEGVVSGVQRSGGSREVVVVHAKWWLAVQRSFFFFLKKKKKSTAKWWYSEVVVHHVVVVVKVCYTAGLRAIFADRLCLQRDRSCDYRTGLCPRIIHFYVARCGTHQGRWQLVGTSAYGGLIWFCQDEVLLSPEFLAGS
jgi:hypothetical protein